MPTRPEKARYAFLAALLAGGATLWAASGIIAHRISRPLAELVRVAESIGGGNLSSRVRLGRAARGEAGVLAEAINDMAMRIEKQMTDQRELLAAVSHEMRTPLSRIRVLLELLRGRQGDHARLDLLEREVSELDALIGDLLASSRLDFAALSFVPLDGAALASDALERLGLPKSRLVVATDEPQLEGDATLLGRALANLVDNAEKHGAGLEALRVSASADGRALRFEALDRGSGFSERTLENAFRAFQRGENANQSSLGLGLALVQRIAKAHGGHAWAENRSVGGSFVAIEVAKRHTTR
jgi:signal transduction histidine kinase